MRIKRKFDLLTLLTVFVIVGVLISTAKQLITKSNSVQESGPAGILGQPSGSQDGNGQDSLREQYREQYRAQYQKNNQEITTKVSAPLAVSTL